MIENHHQLLVTLKQMGRLLSVVNHMVEDDLPKNPKLFGMMVEGPLHQIDKMRGEMLDFLSGPDTGEVDVNAMDSQQQSPPTPAPVESPTPTDSATTETT